MMLYLIVYSLYKDIQYCKGTATLLCVVVSCVHFFTMIIFSQMVS